MQATALLTSLQFQACKLDDPLPVADTATSVVVRDSLMLKLNTSTLIQGINNILEPSRICSTADGLLYITSSNRGRVYRVDQDGKVTIVLENRKQPMGIKSASNGDIFVTLEGEDKVIKLSNNKVTELASNLQLRGPRDLAIDNNGILYIADTKSRRIIRLDQKGNASILAGKTGVFGIRDGVGQDAHFSYPTNIRLSSDGFLWVIDGNGVDKEGQTLRRITLKGAVNTYMFQKHKGSQLQDLAVSRVDKYLQPATTSGIILLYQDRTISHYATNGVETNLFDNTQPGFVDGNPEHAKFAQLTGLTFRDNTLYIVDAGNNALRKISMR